MKTTLSIIKADIGSLAGHMAPSKLLQATVEEQIATRGRGVNLDHYISHTGDDIAILMTHAYGEGDEQIHKLAWDAFLAGTQVAREQGLSGADQDLLKDSFSGNVRGVGPAVAEMERLYRANGPALEAWSPTVDIQQSNGNLIITAEREHKVEEEGYQRYERSYGKFYRSIPLPEGAKPDQAKAELNEGVLKISVPAPEVKKKMRQIAVEQGTEKKPVAA